MKLVTSLPTGKSRLIIALLAGVMISFLGGNFLLIKNVDSKELVVSQPSEKVYLGTNTMPVLVSGIVRASDQTIIVAETAGRVVNLASEGSEVERGEMISEQALPVDTARLLLVEAQATLADLQQESEWVSYQTKERQSETRLYSAKEIAILRESANDTDLKKSTEILAGSARENVILITKVIDFVNNHRPLFTAEGLNIYEDSVKDFYGYVPSYFSGGMANSIPNNEFSISDLSNDEIGVVEALSLSSVLEELNDTLLVVLETGEEDVFERQASVSEEEKVTYLNFRESLVVGKNNLQEKSANLSMKVDGVLADNVSQDSNVQVLEEDRKLSEMQVQLAKEIKQQTHLVGERSQRLAETIGELGRVKAPFAGVISERLVTVGEYVTAGTPLLTLVGGGAREVSMSVPNKFLEQIEVGQFFVSEGGVKLGTVDRFSPVVKGGAGQVIISLFSDPAVGASVTGYILLSEQDSFFVVERDYLHFNNTGPYLRYEDGSETPLSIEYDLGNRVFVKVAKIKHLPLVSAKSVNF